jgi:hypothetical protein
MPPAIGHNRARDLAYAMRWLAIHDAEDVIHDAYEVALMRGRRPTSLRLAIKQCMGRFVAARARGWSNLGEAAERVAAPEGEPEHRVDLGRALATCEPGDLETLIELQGGARALSRVAARRMRRARRRVTNCLIADC